MRAVLIFLSFIIFTLLESFIKAYDFQSTATCSVTNNFQSPINIISANSVYYDDKFFRVLTNNYGSVNANWQNFVTEQAIGFTVPVSNNSTIQIVKDWYIQQFVLTKVLFRTVSEHKLDGTNFDVEMQLFHTVDTTFQGYGRRQTLPVQNLVISVFFVSTSTVLTSPQLWNFANLAGFATTTGTTQIAFNRRLVLGQLVQNVPSYFYQGTYTYPNCDNTYWMISSKYVQINQSDLANIKTALNRFNYIDTTMTPASNSRAIQNNVLFSQIVYRNFQDVTKLAPGVNYFSYQSSSFLKFGTILVFMVLSILL